MTSEEFCRRAADLLGQPYSKVDCIGVVRLAANIRCQGTNWLWRSYTSSGKYQYLTARIDRPPAMSELIDGMLVFRIGWNQIPAGYSDKPNCHHVGIIVGDKVIQSQEQKGVWITPYKIDDWDAFGWLRQVERPPIYNVETPAETPITDDELLNDHEMILALYHMALDDHDMITALYNTLLRD